MYIILYILYCYIFAKVLVMIMILRVIVDIIVWISWIDSCYIDYLLGYVGRRGVSFHLG